MGRLLSSCGGRSRRSVSAEGGASGESACPGGGSGGSSSLETSQQTPAARPSPVMSLLSRRSTRSARLTRLPSKPGESSTAFNPDGLSCPNSPAVKKVYRLVIVGAPRTGKTAVVGRFLDKEFEERYLPTIENFHRKIYKIKGEIYQLDIVDTSGNDPFPAARKLSFISGDMFILCASVDLAHSVPYMIDVRQQIGDCKASRGVISSHEIPSVFALNKTDIPENRWQITKEETLARLNEAFGKEGTDNFVTCSAFNDENIDKVFARVFAQARCPKHMNPELHKMLRNELSADEGGQRKHILQRMRSKFSRDGDEPAVSVYTDLNARRPSLRTDLLMNRAKTSVVNAQTVGKISAPSTSRTTVNDNADPARCSIQ